MKLTRLHLNNFRGFEKLDIEFDERLTVLVGVNGSGKSSVLEAVCIELSRFTDALPIPTNRIVLSRLDVRRGSSDCAVQLGVRALPDATERVFSESLSSGPADPYAEGLAKELRKALLANEDLGAPTMISMPVDRSAFDSTDMRSWPTEEDTGPEYPRIHELTTALVNTAGKRTHRPFFWWYVARENAENAARLSGRQTEFRDLGAVRRAIETFVDGVTKLRVVHPGTYDDDPLFRGRTTPVLSVRKGDDLLLFDQLSDGERTLFAMIGDIARRLAIANPTGNPLEGEAIVLIDEIELHLHPSWQRQVLPKLLETFPNTQFVVTTHSPQVISQVQRSQLRILEEFRLIETNPYVEGRDSNSILYEVFGVSGTPETTNDELRAIGEALNNDDIDAARAGLQKLAEKLGEDDLEIIRAERLIESLSK